MLQREKELYEFGSFRLDITEHSLTRLDGNQNSSLPEKSFKTLCVLVRNSGRLLTKQDLLDQVWPDSFVEENNLDKCIHAIRHALGEKPGEQKFIETVWKHGYRFVADVSQIYTANGFNSKETPTLLNQEPYSTAQFLDLATVVAGRNSSAVVDRTELRDTPNEKKSEDITFAPEPDETVQPARFIIKEQLWKKRPWLIVPSLAGLLFGALAAGYYFIPSGNTAVSGTKSIAVLPLKSVSVANRDEIYEIGIADSLIHKLSSIKGFVVRPLSATRNYINIEQDPLAAGREQKADYVLASNYQLAGGKIRVTSQLINVANGQIEETYKSEKDAANVFAMQDAVADEVGKILMARFGTTSNTMTATRGTTNEEAYRLYLQGMYLYDKRTLADARKAVEVLEQAVHMDTKYALAWAGKAHAHRAVVNHAPFFDDEERETKVHEQYQKSIEAINKALALDENLAEAYSALCENRMYYEYDFAGAELACKRAVELNPDSSLAHQIYARYLNTRGRHDEAIAESKIAIDLEPASLFNQRVYGTCLYFARRYEESIAQFKRVIAMEKNFSSAYQWLRFALEMQGNESEILDWFLKSPRMQDADEETIRAFQTAFQTSGWQGVLREQVRRFAKGDEAYFQCAAKHAQIGNTDKAFEYLNKSYQRRELWIANLQVDPRLDSLRGDPRFDVLVKRVGLK